MNRHPVQNGQEGSKGHPGNRYGHKSYNWRRRKQKQTMSINLNSPRPFGHRSPDSEPPMRSTDKDACNASQAVGDGNSVNSHGRSLFSPPTSFLGGSDCSLGASSYLLPSGGIGSSPSEVPEFSCHDSFSASFRGDKRIRESISNVGIGGRKFVIVSRAVSGHCDAVYRRSRKLWERVPLGQARVFLRSRSPSPSPSRAGCSSPSPPSAGLLPVAALNGLRRFGEWKDAVAYGYGVGNAAPRTVIAMEKIDGEGGQLAAFVVDRVGYWVIGSGGAYRLLPVDAVGAPQPGDDDDASTGAPSAAALAGRMALLWGRLLRARLGPDGAAQLHEALAARGWTCCFDAVLPGWEHAVGRGRARTGGGDAEGSLVFYAATLGDALEKGLCVPVLEAMDLFRRYHLPTASYHGPMEVNSKAYDAYRVQVSGQINSAGAVLYGENEVGVVIRIWKCLSYPYLMERATQELIVTRQLQGPELMAKIEKKLCSLPKGTRVHTMEWEKQRVPFLMNFAAWLHQTKHLTPSTDLRARRELRSHWITAQQAYQNEVAAYRQASGNPSMGEALPAEKAVEDNGDAPHVPDVLMLVGPQGSGKSSLARALFDLLEQSGFSPLWVNQDEIGSRHGYFAAIRQAVSEGHYTHIILDKMNLNSDTRLEYVPMKLNVVLTVAWTHLAGTEALADLCFERVKKRGSRHRTFGIIEDGHRSSSDASGLCFKTQLQRVRGIIHSSAAQCELPEDDPTLLKVDAAQSCIAIVCQVWLELQERGHHNLPDLSKHDMINAVKISGCYERLIAQYPYRVAAAVLKAQDDAALHAVVPPALLGDRRYKVKLDSVQIILHDFIMKPSPTAFVRYASLIGGLVVLKPTAIVADERATLLCFSKCGEGGSAAGPSLSTPKKGLLDSTHKLTSGKRARHPTHNAKPGDCSNVRKDEASLPLIAVLLKGRKVSKSYCMELAQRVLNTNKPDRYCTMLTLHEESPSTFNYQFVAKM